MNVFYKNDAGKPDLTLLPYCALSQAALVASFGSKKYGRDNWKQQNDDGDTVQRFIAAALRHLYQRSAGEQLDAETGLDHLAHAAISCLFALELATAQETNSA